MSTVYPELYAKRSRREKRRIEATARQAISDKRSLEERIKVLDDGGFTAVRERARIAKLIKERDRLVESEKKASANKGKKHKE